MEEDEAVMRDVENIGAVNTRFKRNWDHSVNPKKSTKGIESREIRNPMKHLQNNECMLCPNLGNFTEKFRNQRWLKQTVLRHQCVILKWRA